MTDTTQNKKVLQSIEGIKAQTLASIKDNQAQFDTSTKQIKNDINLFKEEFDARLLELADYEQQIGELRRDLSLLDKKFKTIEKEAVSMTVLDKKLSNQKSNLEAQITKLEKNFKTLNQKLTTNLSRLDKDINLLMKTSSSTATRIRSKKI